ncbi:MAG: glutathione-disulfide reductase [Gammaproteobacteria bacterium]|nr:glutathione-disulfide reductase [Gammaproteobacteria bacterium]
MFDFDLFVIGAGSGGVRTARMSASYGARVAIAEDRYMGGTCVNVGCVPKKLYSYASHFRYDCTDSKGFGWQGSVPAFDWNVLRDNKTAEISRLNGIYDTLLDGSGVTLYNGRARLLDKHMVEIGDKKVSSEKILIATGGWPFVPEFPGSELAVTSNEIFDLPSFPERILVVGGGYIALEFAGIFAGLGADTSLSYRGEIPLKHFDKDLREKLYLESERHMTMLMKSNVEEITKKDNELHVKFKEGNSLVVDCVLYATGRKPNTENLGLENTGVSLQPNGAIAINEHFETTEPGIYALGDVVGRIALTPVAIAEGMVLASNLFKNKEKTMDYSNIATAVFSHPNVGTVGLGEEQAKAEYGDIEVFESDFRHLKHTLSGNPERTYMKLIVDKATDRVVGMHMMGADAGEIIQGLAVAMQCGVTKAQLDSTIGIHPTAAEEFVTMRQART